jgi:hypothetical protein
MEAAALPALADWESFYVIVGSSAAALTGLQFVVIALMAEARARSTNREIDAFATPTVVHFCAALLVSSVLSAPWHALVGPALSLGASGLAGVTYTVIVAQRARRQTRYKPVLEDWLWHAALPLVAYSSLAVAAAVLRRHPMPWLFVVGAAALLLLFIGIHNAWDTVIFITVERLKGPEAPGDASKPDGTAGA